MEKRQLWNLRMPKYKIKKKLPRRNIQKEDNGPKMHQIEEDNTPPKKIVLMAENEIVPGGEEKHSEESNGQETEIK